MTYDADSAYLNPETLSLYCNTNARLLREAPRAYVPELPGLGGGSCLGGTLDMVPYEHLLAPYLAERGILLVYAFPGPWSWMNRAAIRATDALFPAALTDAYVADLCAAGHDVTYHRLPNCGHGILTEAEWGIIRDFLTGHLIP